MNWRSAILGGCLVTASIGLTISCAGERPRTTLSKAEKEACLADGGRLAMMGLFGGEGCARPMTDAGKACTDGSQCQGRTCLLDTGRPDFKPPADDAQVVGQCAPTDHNFACRWRVFDGRARQLCVD